MCKQIWNFDRSGYGVPWVRGYMQGTSGFSEIYKLLYYTIAENMAQSEFHGNTITSINVYRNRVYRTILILF